jgi:hypothetical protein
VRLVGKPRPGGPREVFDEYAAGPITPRSFIEDAPQPVAPEEVAEATALTIQMPPVGDVRSLVSTSDRERAAEILLGDDNGAAVLANIRQMAMAKQRSNHWASLYAEIVGWTGTKAALLAWIMGQLNCSLTAAQDAVKQIQRTPNDPHEIADMCRAYLKIYDAPDGPGKDRPKERR